MLFLQQSVSFFDEFAVMSESELKAWKVGDHTKFGNPINPISVYSALRQLRSTSSYYAVCRLKKRKKKKREKASNPLRFFSRAGKKMPKSFWGSC